MCLVSNAFCFSICIFRIFGLHFTTLPILIYLYIVAVICGKTAVTWFAASTNQRRSAFSIPHFTFRIPQFRNSAFDTDRPQPRHHNHDK